MRKFLLINGLILIIGYVIAQTPKVTGDFAQGLRCVSASQSAMFNFINSSGNQGGITHVKWEIKDNATGNVINTNSDASNNLSYVYLFSQAGTYRCVMTVSWGGTVRMDSMKVTVHTMPKFSYTKSTDSICPGEGITFNYTMISPFTKGMVKSVSWDFGDGGRSTVETPTYNYKNGMNVESSYTVSLTVTDTNQCEATVDSVRYIFVRTKPVVRFAADNTYFCFGNTSNPQGTPIFTNYTDTGKTGINNTYQWNFGDGATSTSEHPSHTYGPGDYVVTLVATSQYGCVDSLRRNNYITVKHLVPTFIISDTILCSLPATISAEGKDGSVYYDWLIDNMTGGGQTGRTPEFKIRDVDEGIHTLKLTIEDRRATGEKCTVDTTITLHFYNKITSTITAADTNECDPNHVISFTNTTQYKPWAEDFGMGKTYWNFGDATNGTGPTTTHVYGTSAVPDGEYPDGGYGDYRVMMSGTTPYGCPLDTVYQNIHIFRMHAVAEMTNPAPPDPPHGCAPHAVELANIEDSLVTSSDIVSFIWKWNFTGDKADPNDTTIGDISGAVQHTYTDTGQYYVYLTLTNEQGCVHDIFVKYIMVGYPPVTDFTFEPDTNCKSELTIRVKAYDSLDANGNLVSGKETGNGSRANGWEWLDDNDSPIGGPTDTSTISPNEVGDAVVNLVSSHNGCKTEFPVRKEALGYVCPPIATIKEPKDDDSGNPPLYCKFEEIPFENDSKGALYLKWYAGDYFPNKDTAEHSKSPLIVYDTTLKDYIRYDENGDSVGTGANWAFTYSDTSASDYLMKGNGLVTLWLWAMNNDTTIMDTTNEFFNMCRKKCEHVATQDLIISILKMNFTVSQDGICQGDSVRFYDSTQASVGIFGWGFKFDSAWNSDPNYLDMTLGNFVEIKNYTPDPKYGNGHWYPFTKPNKYRVVLQDTCVYGCIETDTLVIDVLPKSVPRITTSVDGITYNYGKADTLCINSGGQYYLRDSSWSSHPYENTQIIGWDWLLGSRRDTVQHPVIVQTGAGYYDLKLTVKNEFGCDSTGTFEYQLLANNIIPRFTTPKKEVCNKIEISFTDETTVLPIANNKNTLLEIVYDWGDGDTSVIRSKSGERLTTGHSYDLPNLKNTVYIKLTATIIDPVTYLPTGCKEEYIDSIVVNRPIAEFTDDGHEFPCPDNTSGAKGRTILFTSLAQGELGNNAILRWNFGDTASGSNNDILGRATDSTVISPIHRYNSAGVYDVLFIVQDENTCTDSIWKKNHVVILGPRGDVSNIEDSSNCKPLQVTFYPLVEQDQGFQPDSIVVHVGTGDILVNKGDYYGLTRSRRHVYQNAGAYLPVYFFYKTVQFSGRDETCIVQVVAEDSIYVIDLEPNFQTEPLYCPEIPITFNNTSKWEPSYLGDTSVTMSWNMGNGDTSQNYHGETQYDTGGIYPVTLTAQVLRCIREKVIDIEVMDIPQVSLNPDTAAACDGLEVIFTADSLSDIDKGRILHYEWVFEDGTTMEGNPASREFIESGEYPYTLTLTFTPTGCSETYYDTVTIFAHKSPVAAFEADPKVGEVDQEFTFTDKSIKGDGDIVRWFWDYGDGNQSPDSLNQIQTHAYSSTSGAILVTLFIKDEFGCQATIDDQITVTEKLNLPNLFTPGGNCPNGKCGFRPIENKGYFKEFTMEIYDKWGVLVWRKKCTDQNSNCPDYEGDGFWWDGTNKQGKQVADGVYYWVIYALPLSETDPFIKNGSITVVNGQK